MTSTGSKVPRLVVAGTASGVGKTTAVVGLARALEARGLRVALFKCGPDYLDPTYHVRAVHGRPCHNLDGWMMGRRAVLNTFVRGTSHADIALIEGVMGLFDGASPNSDAGSSAEIAKWLEAPVLLVVDASGMARSVAAIAKGYAELDPGLHVAGLLCNRIGSKGHLDLLARATHRPPVVGGFPLSNEDGFAERHLGLHTADAQVTEYQLDSWGERAREWIDLDRVVTLADEAGGLVEAPAVADLRGPVRIRASEEESSTSGVRCRIGIAYDEAFHFYYEDNLARLAAHGAELVRFSPVHDRQLPEVDGLYLGGGYPEVHAAQLAANAELRAGVAEFARQGGPVYAECGGLMYLAQSIRTPDGEAHAMTGLLPAEALVCERLQALGYVEVETQEASVLGGAGVRFRGHQFRYSELTNMGDMAHVYTLRRRRGGSVQSEGYQVRSLPNVLASYVHAHWASNSQIAEAFVARCAGESNV